VIEIISEKQFITHLRCEWGCKHPQVELPQTHKHCEREQKVNGIH